MVGSVGTVERYRAKTKTGKVHMVRKSGRFPEYHIQNCDGRAITGAVKVDDPLTCKRCQEHEYG